MREVQRLTYYRTVPSLARHAQPTRDPGLSVCRTSLRPSADQSAAAPAPPGYVAIGFAEDPDSMYPADIALGWAADKSFFNTYHAEVRVCGCQATMPPRAEGSVVAGVKGPKERYPLMTS